MVHLKEINPALFCLCHEKFSQHHFLSKYNTRHGHYKVLITFTLFVLFFTLSYNLSSQTGPGGVGQRDVQDKLILWLTAGEGVTVDDNDYVLGWDDISGYNNDAFSSASERPVLVGGAVNGFPALSFDGLNDQLTISGHSSLQPDYITIIAVVKREATTGWGDIISRPYYAQNSWISPYTSYTINSCTSHFGSSTNKPFSQVAIDGNQVANWDPPHDIVANGTTYVHALVYDGNGMGSYLNNASIAGYSAYIEASGVLDYNGNTADVSIGTRSAYLSSNPTFDHFLNGKLAEIVLFNEAISEVEHIIVVNSFAAKYNVTIGWDQYTEQAGFVYDVIGVGKDDDREHLVSEAGNLRIESASFSTNASYVFSGHNNGLLTHTTSNVPAAYDNRVSRIWYLASTGTKPATVTLIFTLNHYPGTNMGEYGLLYSASSDLSGVSEVMKATNIVVQDKTVGFEVGAASLNNGYYTLGSTVNHWCGTVSDNWNTASNWENGEVPDASTNITIIALPTDDSPPVINTGTNMEVNNMYIESSATLHIGPGTTLLVNGELDNNNGVEGITLGSDVSGTGGIIQGSENVQATVERYLAQTKYHYITSPVKNQNISPEFINTQTNPLPTTIDFYKYDEAQNLWINIKDDDGNLNTSFETSFVAGRGYAVAYGDADKTKDFTGVLATGNQAVTLTRTGGSGFEGWNLTGNPFPSSIAANWAADETNNLLLANAAALDDEYEAVYLWDESESHEGYSDDYITVNQASEATFISNGQAFMVRSASDGVKFNIGTALRKHGASHFYKESEGMAARLYLKIVGPLNDCNEILIAFSDLATIGLDPGYDSKKLKGNQDIALYSNLVNGQTGDYAIQTLPVLSDSTIVPIGLDAWQPGVYEFTARGMSEFQEDMNILFLDNDNNACINLREVGNYVFEISETGKIPSRFELCFYYGQAGGSTNPVDQKFDIYSVGRQIIIRNIEGYNIKVSVYDLVGRKILEKRGIDSGSVIFCINSQPGYYLVKIKAEDWSVTKKVLIF